MMKFFVSLGVVATLAATSCEAIHADDASGDRGSHEQVGIMVVELSEQAAGGLLANLQRMLNAQREANAQLRAQRDVVTDKIEWKTFTQLVSENPRDDTQVAKCVDMLNKREVEGFTCAVCLEDIKPSHTVEKTEEDSSNKIAGLQCGHMMCEKCTRTHVSKSQGPKITCPTCRADVGQTFQISKTNN
jgi:hypothetical protein